MDTFLANTTFSSLSTTTLESNGTNSSSTAVGYICSAVAVIFYGSNFVPVKQYQTGDGMFFQWVLCSGIYLVGISINIYRHSTFYPLAMLGGVIWSTGNLCVVPIFKTIGLSIGLCLWATTNLIFGWVSASYGWFGINPQKSNNDVLNYTALATAILSGVVYTQVKNNVSEPINPAADQVEGEYSSGTNLTPDNSETIYIIQKNDDADISFFDKLSPLKKRILGTTLALISGMLYGLNFVPAIYIQDNFKSDGSSQNGLDYVFAHFSGIFMTGSGYFILYIMYHRNNIKVYPRVILPGIISGIMWGIATACFFVANQILLEPVSFPIINTGPMLIASAWGVLLYKEITGIRNMIILMFAFCLTITTGLLAGFSKS